MSLEGAMRDGETMAKVTETSSINKGGLTGDKFRRKRRRRRKKKKRRRRRRASDNPCVLPHKPQKKALSRTLYIPEDHYTTQHALPAILHDTTPSQRPLEGRYTGTKEPPTTHSCTTPLHR